MKKILLFLICLSAKMLLAQTDSNLVRTRYVLANVLNMRAKPSEDANITAKIPKFSQVEELENLSQIDSIASVNIGEWSSGWSKIKCQNKIGYVASYYIAQPIIIDKYETTPISVNYPYWYKIDPKSDGDYLKKIEVKLDTIKDDALGDERIFIVEKNKKAVDGFTLQFGSFITLKTGKISSFYQKCFDNRENEYEENDNEFSYERKCNIKIKDKNVPIFIKNEPRFKDFHFEREVNKVFFSNGTKKQLILSAYRFYQLNWFGDLDADNKPDFILEAESNIFLFLSSRAKKGNFVQMVSHHHYNEGD